MVRRRKKRINRGGLQPDKYLSDEQCQKMWDYIEKTLASAGKGTVRAMTNKMLIVVLYYSGVRASELCELRLRNLPGYHGKDVIFVEYGKGLIDRAVEIPKKVSAEISEFIKVCRKGARPGSRLFVNERGGDLSYRSLWSRVTIIGRAAGTGKLTPHMLRHTCLTMLYNIDKDLRFVQDQAGHASIKTTEIYAKTLNRERRRQIEELYRGSN